MQLIPVTSSNIHAVGYDADTETLHVEFKSGSTYSYAGVPEHEHQELLSAPSVGSHFAKRIRPHYAGVKQ